MRHAFLAAVCLLSLTAPACDRRAAAPSTAAHPAVDYAAIDVLLQRMHQRLELMHTVARIKWNTQAPIFDPEREQALLKDVVERGQSHALDAEVTRSFFVAQMEAAKFIQESDFQRWRAEKSPPFTDVPDLPTLRKQLDALNRELLAALAQARPILNSPEGQHQLDDRARQLFADFEAPVRGAALQPLRR
ncbi:MAG: gamma subclass chorismate mutase AroQ [Planctomycetes bacterium]|nr:gamma subclass chorismate mutase AroQ [Planctomycetota bacterium]